MARIRSVHPGMASDEAFMSMSMAAKAAWPLLWTECDDAGVFEWKPIVLKARIFPADNVDFASLLTEWVELGCVKKVEEDGKAYGIVRNFCRFQRPKNPSYRHPNGISNHDFTGFKPDHLDITPVTLPQPSPSPTEKSPQMEEGGGKGTQQKEPSGPSVGERAARSPRPTRIDPGWDLGPEELSQAQNAGLDDDRARQQWPRFKDHFLAAPGERGLKRDWMATWRNWCRKTAEGFGQSGSHGPSGNGQALGGRLGAFQRAAGRFSPQDDVSECRPDVFGYHRH